jgi:hypothetical protein
VVQQAKEMINELEKRLPVSPEMNFRARLVAHMEHLERRNASTGLGNADLEFQQKAAALLIFFEKHFGVKDFFDNPEEE